ncbi:PREDICTED: integrin beta pat-3-like [Papilio xuthus]|uniref:Integrin beta n=1 Tax=Papilio xuthus TaxID=66420 RepID=A0AAJ7EKL6_PAPXU|nr:PREDICTED: integrin beta pat-3-like [Papilio xuthus]
MSLNNNLHFLKIIIFLTLKFNIILSQSNCPNLVTCGACIAYADDSCVWCSSESHTGPRCKSKDLAKATWCSENVTEAILSHTILRNDELNSGENGVKIQFTPQTMTIKVRPGLPVDFNMAYRPAKDYPLDVYYVMDYSFTMRAYQNLLQEQGLEIYKELTLLTNNVRLGIGSFVDKPAYPFKSSDNEAYSFKNHLSLTQNMTEFQNVLKDNLFGSNNDDPEGGFDALMQVMLCQDEIGWRENARRIIILSTDNTYHSAGDGKFVGAVKPNDMKCHLEDNNYNMGLDLDYPSVSQINKIATEHNFKIIFAAISSVKDHYEGLVKKIRGAKYVELSKGSNLVTMVKEEYLKLIRSMEINADLPPHIELALSPDCRKEGICIIKHNESITINAKLTVKECPSSDEASEVLVGPVALNEKLKIIVTSDCVCDCERKNTNTNSSKCSGSGKYQCGICTCNENTYGEDCGCTGMTSVDLDKCKLTLTATDYCSGRGTCSCGKCIHCKQGFSGDFCQYDDTACPSPGGKLCAGRGVCRYGKCACAPDITGPGCDCPLTIDTCYAPHSKEMCSGTGNCICGECQCLPMKTSNRTCSGRFCDNCDEFAEKRCLELENYAECNYLYNKTYCDQLHNQTSLTEVKIVDKLDNTLSDQGMAKWCKKELWNGTLIFKYLYPITSPNTLHVIIAKELEQPPEVNLLIAVGVPFGILVLIGLLTIIIWKILVDRLDAREYKNFAEKAAAAGFTVTGIVNPVYRPPATNITNPMFDANL